MALLIYQKKNPQAIFVEGSMEKLLNELTSSISRITFKGWNGKPIAFFKPHDNWMHVEEWDDKDVEEYLKKQKEQAEMKQRAMATRGQQLVMPNRSIPGRRN